MPAFASAQPADGAAGESLRAVTAAALPSAAPAARVGDGRRCCWKILVKAKGSFGTAFEPRVSTDPDDRGHHVWGDKLGKYSFRWTWQSRGLYGYRELRSGGRRVPVLDGLGSGRGFELATAARGEFHSSETYCLIEHDTGIVDGDVVVVGERCEAPPVNPCLLDQVARWKRGGSHSGVRLHGGPKPRDTRTFLDMWVQGLFPYDGTCVQFATISGHHGPPWLVEHGMHGSDDYVLLAPRKIGAKLRGRRSFSFVPREGDYTAFHGLRPNVGGTHPRSDADDDDQPHSYGGKTSVKVKFVYFPKRKLARERKRLRRPSAGCGRRPTLAATPKTITHGERVTFKGACFKPRKPVALHIGPPGTTGERFASARTNAKGAFTKRYTSSTSEPGTYVVAACQNGCRVKAQTRIILK